MEEFEKLLSPWVEVEGLITPKNKQIFIQIKCFRYSLSSAFFIVKEHNKKSILLCLPLSSFVSSTVTDAQLTLIIQGMKVYSATFLVNDPRITNLINSQIAMCTFLSTKTNFDKILPSHAISINQEFIEKYSQTLVSVNLISRPLPLLPFEFCKESLDTWKKRNIRLNSNYFLKKKNLQVTFMTWNVGHKIPEEWTSKEMSFIFQKNTADLVFISIEEIDFGARAVIFGGSGRCETWNDIWTRSAIDFNYEPIVQEQFGSVYVIGLKRKGEDRFNISASLLFSTRLGIAASKSAVAVNIRVDETNFVVVGAHLEAHDESLDMRNQQFHEICSLIQQNAVKQNIRFDYFIIFGDLNYRIDYPFDETKFLAKNNNITELLSHDQLLATKKKDKLIAQFEEAEITFRPTYKFDDYSNVYDTSSKMRTPSYTDRVLIKTRSPYQWTGLTDELFFETAALDVFSNHMDLLKEKNISFQKKSEPDYPSKPVCGMYKSFDVQFSDHRPVVGDYTFQVLEIDKEREKHFHEIE